MDANTELKPQDLLKEILKKNSKTELNINPLMPGGNKKVTHT